MPVVAVGERSLDRTSRPPAAPPSPSLCAGSRRAELSDVRASARGLVLRSGRQARESDARTGPSDRLRNLGESGGRSDAQPHPITDGHARPGLAFGRRSRRQGRSSRHRPHAQGARPARQISSQGRLYRRRAIWRGCSRQTLCQNPSCGAAVAGLSKVDLEAAGKCTPAPRWPLNSLARASINGARRFWQMPPPRPTLRSNSFDRAARFGVRPHQSSAIFASPKTSASRARVALLVPSGRAPGAKNRTSAISRSGRRGAL
jgi:hypothetical protein